MKCGDVFFSAQQSWGGWIVVAMGKVKMRGTKKECLKCVAFGNSILRESFRRR